MIDLACEPQLYEHQFPNWTKICISGISLNFVKIFPNKKVNYHSGFFRIIACLFVFHLWLYYFANPLYLLIWNLWLKLWGSVIFMEREEVLKNQRFYILRILSFIFGHGFFTWRSYKCKSFYLYIFWFQTIVASSDASK